MSLDNSTVQGIYAKEERINVYSLEIFIFLTTSTTNTKNSDSISNAHISYSVPFLNPSGSIVYIYICYEKSFAYMKAPIEYILVIWFK